MTHTTRWTALMAMVTTLLCGTATARAQETDQPKPDDAALIGSVARSVVIVEHAFRYDRSEAPEPEAAGVAYNSAEEDMDGGWASLILQERPEQRLGFVIAPDLVLTVDPLVHNRFVARIQIRDGDRLIGARPEAYAVDQNAVLLRLDEPLTTAEPLEFDPDSKGPYKAIHGRRGNSRWWLMAAGVDGSTMVSLNGPKYHVVPWPSVIVDGAGTAVGACFDGGLETNGSWKSAPAAWDWIAADKIETLIERVGTTADAALPRVELRFRSPRKETGANQWSQNAAAFTEWNGTGIMLDGQRVLVLAQFEPKVTARLESAIVHTADGQHLPAEFAGSLRDYAALVVHLQTPLDTAATLAEHSLLDVEDELLIRSQVRVLGENRTSYTWQARLARMMVGFRGTVLGSFGDVASARMETGAGDEGPMSFLFSTRGELVALPLMVRKRATNQQDWQGYSRSDYEPTVMGTADLLAILERPDALDPDNRPLSESEEHRLAWLGVQLQAMDPDLARFNNVADQTGGGTTGGIVTYVYAGSPAAKAGLQVGDILLRLHIEGQPRPLDIDVNAYDMGWGAQYLEVLEQIDSSYFDRVPPPWSSAETALTRALTDAGFGTPFRAEVVRDGELLEPEFVVEEGPAHFSAAARFKSEPLGLTVRDLTYEARRFMQRSQDDPGVVISKVEAGERGAVAGIKPFELIVAVNDKPIYTVEDFENAI
ncbi:MAG: PDZ domain-containing protein, partial [Planctomycetota bacterium]|nr:PDZ domain-containing protein [Planctomycetota bacterium]